MEKWNYLDFSEWQYNNNVHFDGIVAIWGPRIQGSKITKNAQVNEHYYYYC